MDWTLILSQAPLSSPLMAACWTASPNRTRASAPLTTACVATTSARAALLVAIAAETTSVAGLGPGAIAAFVALGPATDVTARYGFYS